MTIDPKGTTPGLPPQAQEKKPDLIHMACRNPHSCSSKTATVLQIPGQSSQRLYRCSKCQHTWGINLGGAFNL